MYAKPQLAVFAAYAQSVENSKRSICFLLERCGSGSVFLGASWIVIRIHIYFVQIRIWILPSTSKKIDKNLNLVTC
jgi:hypothetical protein